MTQEQKTLIAYRLERARETLKEADVLLKHGHVNSYVNRLYYACFYAVSALLLTKDLSSVKHSGLRALFHREFVKPGIVSTELAELYDTLFRSRQKSDYADFVRFDVNEVKPWYNDVGEFVEVIERVINKETEEN